MNFILPNHFSESLASLRTIFKVKGDSKVTLLSQERVSRAKKMMTPFVLRRRKDQVLHHRLSYVLVILDTDTRSLKIFQARRSGLSGAT